jgi:hypothetical protein
MNKENFINRRKATAEELRLQLHSGSRDLIDNFETQKRENREWCQHTMANLEDEASETSLDLQRKLKALEVQAAMGKAETKEAIQVQRKKLSYLVKEAQASINLPGDSKKNVRELAFRAEVLFDKWLADFDLLRLQFNWGAAEASDEWNKRKVKLRHSINDRETKSENTNRESEEGWINFKKEISEARAHVKKAYS